MNEEIPIVDFNQDQNLGIEVMTLKQLYQNLGQSEHHSPFYIHRIEFYLIIIITKNTYTHFIDFNQYTISAGSAIFIAKNQVHHFYENNSAEGYGIVFNHFFVNKNYTLSNRINLNRLFNYHIESPVLENKEVRADHFIEIVSNMHYEYAFADSFAKLEILSSLLNVLLLKAERAKEFQAVVGIKPHWLDTFNQFKNLLENEYTASRNSNYYASKLFISYKFLNDVVKKISGKTVKSFIDDFTTIEIKRYLTSTSLSVKEISFVVGFDDTTNMIKFFKKQTNMTPLKFREEN